MGSIGTPEKVLPSRISTIDDKLAVSGNIMDSWPRIKPRFGLNLSSKPTVLAIGSPVKTRKRELSPPGSPDLFKTPSKRVRVNSKEGLLSSPPPSRGNALLWGTDYSPMKSG